MTRFSQAFEHVMKWEGGDKITDDPRDPGGLTRFGISLRAHPDIGADGIRNLTRDKAMAIYRTKYWNACDCDYLRPGLALMVFDTAVNCGVKRAERWLRESGGNLTKLSVSRAYHYATLDHLDDIYGRGWFARLFSTYDAAKVLDS